MQPQLDRLVSLQSDLIGELNINIEKLDNEKQKTYVKECIEKAKKGEQLDIKTIVDNLNKWQ